MSVNIENVTLIANELLKLNTKYFKNIKRYHSDIPLLKKVLDEYIEINHYNIYLQAKVSLIEKIEYEVKELISCTELVLDNLKDDMKSQLNVVM